MPLPKIVQIAGVDVVKGNVEMIALTEDGSVYHLTQKGTNKKHVLKAHKITIKA